MSNEANEVAEDAPVSAESARPILPMWLRKALPEPLPITSLSWANGKLRFSHNGSEFPDYASAYEYANFLYDTYELALDDSLEGQSGRFVGTSHEMFHVEDTDEDGKKMVYMTLYATSIATSAETLVNAYKKWMSETVPSYEANPDDFYTAYKFLSNHPIFWTLPDGESAAYAWLIIGGLDGQRVDVYPSGSGGAHTFHVTIDGQHERGDKYKTRMTYLTHTASGPSYEEAIIGLAKVIRELYSLDGTPRVTF